MSSRTFAIVCVSALCALVGCGGGGSGGTGGGGGAGGAGGAGTSTTGTNTGSPASSGAGGGNTQVCGACLDPLFNSGGECAATEDACQMDADCDAWMNCTSDCFDGDFTDACWSACDAAHTSSAALHDAMVTCLCNKCSAECGVICN